MSAQRPNVLALTWVDEALELEQENRELRRILTSLFFYIAEREDLAGFARAQIARRWPDVARAAA